MLKRLEKIYSGRHRKKRSKIFLDYLKPCEDDKILDLGSENGSYIASIVPFRNNVFIADISPDLLEEGRRRFGFKTVLLDESAVIPYPDKYFDIVFASSVIEHVTVDKINTIFYKSDRQFKEAALARQLKFANEIRRVGKRYFVQTPNRYFPIESHTWLPLFVVFLPRSIQIKFIRFLNYWWPKKTSPDWSLLTKTEMENFFPEAEIILEKSFGFTKSIIAIKK